MKYSTILFFILVLSGCSTTHKEQPKDMEVALPTMNVLAEVCIKPSKKNTLNVVTTERSGSIISSHSYQGNLKNKTSDNMNVYSFLVGKSVDLTYFTVENFSDSTTYFLINRNFTAYKLNEWGKWEEPDYLFKEGSQYKFITLSTDAIDNTDKLLKIKFSKQEPVRVRFKLVDAQEYITKLNSDNKTVTNVSACLN